jgi:phosphate/sulfate permease
MRMSPAFHCTLKRLRFGANTVAIAVTLLSTVVTICLNDETKSPASALLAVGFFACFALLWGFVRQDLQERDTRDASDII